MHAAATSPARSQDLVNSRLLCGMPACVQVRAASLTIHMGYTDFADYWQPIANAQGPVGDYVKRLGSEDLDRLTAAVRRAYLAGAADGPRSMAATAWAACGVVP
jgi:hypothetical protein